MRSLIGVQSPRLTAAYMEYDRGDRKSLARELVAAVVIRDDSDRRKDLCTVKTLLVRQAAFVTEGSFTTMGGIIEMLGIFLALNRGKR